VITPWPSETSLSDNRGVPTRRFQISSFLFPPILLVFRGEEVFSYRMLYIFFMAKFEKHIFICGNQRPPEAPRPCCDPEARAELQRSFKEKLAARGLKGKVR